MHLLTRRIIGWSPFIIIGMFVYLNFFAEFIHNWNIDRSFWAPSAIHTMIFTLTAFLIVRADRFRKNSETVVAYALFSFGFACWMAWQSGDFHQYLFWIPLIVGVAVGFGHISIKYLKGVFFGHICMLVLQSMIASEPGTMFQIANATSHFGADFSFSHWYGMVAVGVLYVMFVEKGGANRRQPERDRGVSTIERTPRREERREQQRPPVQQQPMHRKSRPVKKPSEQRAGNQESIKLD